MMIRGPVGWPSQEQQWSADESGAQGGHFGLSPAELALSKSRSPNFLLPDRSAYRTGPYTQIACLW
jgi:hypothetical protein